MSFPQHIERLNEIGRQLATLTERTRSCGDAISGAQAEISNVRDTPMPALNSLEGQFDNICTQFESVLDNLRSEIFRIEEAVIDKRATGVPAKATRHEGY